MGQVARSKITRNLMLLALLAGGFVYLSNPVKSGAQQSDCIRNCQLQAGTCARNCHGNQECIEACTEQFNECVDNCLGY